MFYIKLDANNDLVVTQREAIYRGDNLNRKIIYLIPFQVGEIDPLTAFFYLSYIRPDGIADVVTLERMEERYNESYYQYTFPELINCKLTKFPGEVCTWLQIYSGDPSDPVISKSGECNLHIQESKNMDDYLCDHQVTAIYQFHKDLDKTVTEVGETVEQVATALESKADNIVFHSEDNTIQLTAAGEPVGDRVKISTIDGAVINNAGITVDGELIVSFTDGTMKNLGKVVDDGGYVYVPHISDRKILSFTVEKTAGEVPNPVDLNPFDEWRPIDNTTVVSDYTWEQM